MLVTDPQRLDVYAWEDTLINLDPSLSKPLTASQCLELAFTIYERLDINAPQIHFRHGMKQCFYEANRIVIYDWGRKPIIMLHEIAHDLWARSERPDTVQIHGAEYLRILIDLLKSHSVLDPEVIEHSARNAGLKFQDRDFTGVSLHRCCQAA